MGDWVSFDTSIYVLSSKRSKRITVIQYLIIRYESIEAYEQHGEDISTKYVSYLWTPDSLFDNHTDYTRVKEVFEPCGASDFQPTVSTRTLPPTEFAGYVRSYPFGS